MTSTKDAPATMPRMLQTLSVDTWREIDGVWLLARTQTREMEVVDALGVRKTATRSEDALPFDVRATMWEYIDPLARGKRYEDPLDDFLRWSCLGVVDGGGTQMGETPRIEYLDVTMALANLDVALDMVAAELTRLGAPNGSQLQFVRDGREETRSFGASECVALFLDGTTLPASVYKNSDVNDVLARLEHALATDDRGAFRSHWRGNAETGLFFYGADAKAMCAAMAPVLASEPLCQNARLVARYGRHPSGAEEFRLRH